LKNKRQRAENFKKIAQQLGQLDREKSGGAALKLFGAAS